MNANDYQNLALITAAKREPSHQLNNCALGLAGEAGEFTDHIKKHMFHGHELDSLYLKKELGDILWYVAVAAASLNIPLGEIMQTNVDKLRARYPAGFSAEASKNRAE